VNDQATFGMPGSTSGGVDPRDFAENWSLEAGFQQERITGRDSRRRPRWPGGCA